MKRFLISTACAVGLLVGGAFPARAQPSPTRGTNSKNNAAVLAAFKPVVAKVNASVVGVRVDGKQVALGTVITADGYVLTKESELKSEDIVVRLGDGKELSAKKVAVHEPFDLALLKIEATKLTPIAWTNSSETPVGNWIASVGPGDLPATVGVVSVAARDLPQTRVSMRPSSNRGMLGISLADADDGVRIGAVNPKSAAEKAGLKADDVILKVNDVDIVDPEVLSELIQSFKPGDDVTVVVKRGDKTETFKAVLDKWNPNGRLDRGNFQDRMGVVQSEIRTGFPNVLQHDSDLKAKECGGPIVDLDGHVIGINIARVGRTDTFAVTAEQIKPILAGLKAGKSVAIVTPKAPAAKTTPADDRIKAARDALRSAEDERAAAEKKALDAKAALQRLLDAKGKN